MDVPKVFRGALNSLCIHTLPFLQYLKQPAPPNPGNLTLTAVSNWNPLPLVLVTILQSPTIGELELSIKYEYAVYT